MGFLLDQILAWLTDSVLKSLDVILTMLGHGLLVSPDVTVLPQVQGLVQRSTMVVDAVFVLAFVAAGALTMLAGGEERARYGVKELLPRLVVGFIAAHFSQPACGWAIDSANAVTAALIGDPTGDAGAVAAMRAHLHAVGPATPMLFAILIVIIAVLLASAALGMISRFVLLLVLTAAAPLALACHALPHTDPMARLWWRSFTACLATPVAQAGCLQAGVWLLLDPTHMLLLTGRPGDAGEPLNLFIVVVILATTLRVPALMRRYVLHSGPTGGGAMRWVRVLVIQQGLRRVGVPTRRRAPRAAAPTGTGGVL